MRPQERLAQVREMIAAYRESSARFLFHEVVTAIAGVPVHRVNEADNRDAQLLAALSRAAEHAFERLREAPIRGQRPQRFGHAVKKVVLSALDESGLGPVRPRTERGDRPAAGYPDFEVTDPFGRPAYVLVKTCSAGNVDDTGRTLYLSPPHNPMDSKVTKAARHLLMSFRHEQIVREGRQVFWPFRWAVHDLYDLPVDLKYEFHASNRDIYVTRADLIKREGPLEPVTPPR